ncbi:MAG: aminotransferase class I/II-fold pyridoxal phosphate-dependent enzyme [Candidatus Eremiobacteraeota bacterium]|nr:aminotransferase class I/II-fold pyridoxal phosphate-dependent enzyme [Candidatus Eremiobacteraeota bacterium]
MEAAACVKLHEVTAGFCGSPSLERLRRRSSEKWRSYSPDVLPAFVAEMDFELAPPIAAALHAAIDVGDCGYACVRELPPSVCAYAARALGLSLDPNQVFAVPDVMAGVAQALHVLTPPGSAIVVNPPVYPPFFEVIRTSGREIAEVPLLVDDVGTWRIDVDGLERAFAAGARGYLLCSPHNPVGRVWNAGELRSIAALTKRYRVAVIADEIHAPLTLPGVSFRSFLACADEAQASVALLSASKAWNLAGLKCGAMVAGNATVRTALAKRVKEIPTEIASRVGHLGVIASIAAFRDGFQWRDALCRHLDGNRLLLGNLLRERLSLARWSPPEATYLAWIDCGGLGIGPDPARHFLERGRVALEPGHRFGAGGASFVRLNFGTSPAILTEIIDRMAAAVHQRR